MRSPIFDEVGSNEKARYLLLWNHLRGLAIDGKVRISRDRNELRYYVNEDEQKREKAELMLSCSGRGLSCSEIVSQGSF